MTEIWRFEKSDKIKGDFQSSELRSQSIKYILNFPALFISLCSDLYHGKIQSWNPKEKNLRIQIRITHLNVTWKNQSKSMANFIEI